MRTDNEDNDQIPMIIMKIILMMVVRFVVFLSFFTVVFTSTLRFHLLDSIGYYSDQLCCAYYNHIQKVKVTRGTYVYGIILN